MAVEKKKWSLKMVSRQKNCSGRGTLTHDDVIFLPGYIGFPVDKVDLSIPCVSSPVDTVTESSMARAMAVLGSIGITYSNCPPSEQAAHIRAAKAHPFPILSNPIFQSSSGCICSPDDFATSPCILVTKSGDSNGEILGYVSPLQWMEPPDGDKEAPGILICLGLSNTLMKRAQNLTLHQLLGSAER